MENSGRRTFFWTIVTLVIFISAFMIIKAALPTSDGSLLTKQITAEDWVKGTKGAKITLIEYSDFQCPACAYFSSITNSLVGEFGAHMQLAYRHFPLKQIHANSTIAAQAAEAAGKQGKFWEMHDLLFTKQNEWSTQTPEDATNTFIAYAGQIGITDTTKFLADLNSKEVADKIESDFQSGQDAKINATPTFFLNGVKILNPRSLEEFRKLIRTELEKNT